MSTLGIYERDPAEYVAAFESYLRGWEASEDEHNLATWLTVSGVGSDDPNIFRFIALGYVTATWESWSDGIAEQRLGLTENMRRKSAREFEEKGIPQELHDLIYGTRMMSVRILEEAKPGDESLEERLNLLWEQVVLRNTEFESAPTEETLLGLRSFYNLGIGLFLFLGWQHGMDERAVPEDERWDDIGLAPIYDDRLAELSFPASIRGCTLDEADTMGYEIRSDGKFGGFHLTTFLAEGEVANIIQFVTSGRLGTRVVAMIEPKHADVLRELGFQEAVFPSGQRYRLSSLRGLSGIRKIKD